MAATRTLSTIALALAASWTLVGPAVAAKPPPTPALDQYVETFPTASGPITPTGQPNGTSPTNEIAPLESEVAARIAAEGGKDADTLKKIATQPSLGAPQRQLSPATPEVEEQPEAQPEAAAAAGDSEGRQVELLVLLLAGITLAVGGTAAYRLRHRS